MDLLFVLIGAVLGIVSGLFGIGGGVLIVPALVYLAGFSQHRATGTSLAILLPPIGLAAVVEYYRHERPATLSRSARIGRGYSSTVPAS